MFGLSGPTDCEKGWYAIFGIASGCVAVLSILFVKETKYIRTAEALCEYVQTIRLHSSDTNSG